MWLGKKAGKAEGLGRGKGGYFGIIGMSTSTGQMGYKTVINPPNFFGHWYCKYSCVQGAVGKVVKDTTRTNV